VQFDTAPIIGLDEAVTLYIDAAASTVRRATSSNTTSTANPVWGPANEVATNVIGLDFLYFDNAGQALIPSTTQKRASIATIEARVRVRSAAALADGTQPVYSLSITAQPRNLLYK
jgi:hypothetical protein